MYDPVSRVLCKQPLCLDGGSRRMEGTAEQCLLGVMFSSTRSSEGASYIPRDAQCAFPAHRPGAGLAGVVAGPLSAAECGRPEQYSVVHRESTDRACFRTADVVAGFAGRKDVLFKAPHVQERGKASAVSGPREQSGAPCVQDCCGRRKARTDIGGNCKTSNSL